MDNFVGKRIDARYEIQEVIGVGGMAVVYKAYDTIDERIVAVKILKEEFLANEEFRRKFKNESKAIAILNHPNIVKVYDVSFGEKIQYIVMEYIDGITLKEYIHTQGRINWKEAVHFESQILQALQHAHDKGIIHRDIKPQNIMLLKNGNIKVTDFGIARFARSDTKTMTDSAIGSVHYISPEQARGDFTDEKADLYSSGVVLYEMITGKVPFNADSAVSIAIMQLQKEAVLPRELNPNIPLGLEEITMRAMQKNPRDRYQSAAEMLMDLNELSRNPAITFEYSYNNGIAYNPNEDYTDPNDATKLVNLLEKEDDLEASELEGNNNDDYYSKKYGSVKKDETDAAQKAKKKKIAVIIVAVVAALALVVGGCFALFGGKKITVPQFVGKNYEKEISQYVTDDTYKNGDVECKIKLEYTDDAEKYSDYETGEVVYQNPDSGIKIRKSKSITLTVLSSSEGIAIPDVKGMTKSSAQIELKSKGFSNIVFEEKPSKDIDVGSVIETSPEIGTKVDKTAKLTVYVSSGNTFKMPSVVGMNKDDAEKFLTDYELTIKYEQEDSTKDKDIVIGQSVSEGQSAKMGSVLTLTVSSGTAPTTTTKPTTTQSQTKSITISIPLPKVNGEEVAGGDGILKVYLGNKLMDQATVKCNGGTYKYTCTGTSGTYDVSAEVDGAEVFSGTVNFNTGTYS